MVDETIPARLLERARLYPDHPAYFVKRRGMWQGTSWAGFAAEVQRAAKALLALGVEPAQTIALIGGNRPEWSVLMLAAMSVGARAAGIYTTSSSDETRAILEQTEARLVWVDSKALLERVRRVRAGLPRLAHIVTAHDLASSSDDRELTFSELLARGERGQAGERGSIAQRIAALDPGAVASIVYTSGAEGTPEGVMLSHRNLTWTASVVSELLEIGPSDTVLSYLPLAHISEQLFTVHGPVCTGTTVYYAESTRAAPLNLREVQPTVLFGVPRIWEKMQAGLEARIAQVHGPRARVLGWARGIATRVVHARCEGKDPSIELAAQYELASSLVLDKLRGALGLGRARICLSGAAPIQEETLAFFASLGVQLLEVYGQTESTGPITLNQPRRTRFGSPGPKLPGLTLSIAADGEVLVSGPNVFVGYVGDASEERSRSDGVLHTGDLGKLDPEGFLIITGRKREILVTAGGKNVSPKRLEAALLREELIRDAMVLGDRRRFLTALITIDEEAAQGLGLSGALHDNDVVRERVAQHVEQLNQRLGGAEQIRRHLILPRAFRIETGELTPTMKLRRQRIEELWAKEIEALYAEAEQANARL